MRYSLYFTPETGDGLRLCAERWLADHTVTARGYGFHATLKAPFHLAAGRTERQLREALHEFAFGHAAIGAVAVQLVDLDGFYALVPRDKCPGLSALADDTVRFFDRFRALASQEETARRLAACLTGRQQRNLSQWGYPYVFEDFRFHLTLTDRIEVEHQEDVHAALLAHLGEWRRPALAIDTVTLCRQSGPGQPFESIDRALLSSHGTRVPAAGSHQPASEQRTPADDQ
jgi:hypothetical protein